MSARVRIGASIFFTAGSIQPAELGVELEARGFESLWLPEHSHMPLAQQEELGDRRLPEKYEVVYDAFTSLAAVASTTSRILLGTGITLLGIRDPIWTAKATATLDAFRVAGSCSGSATDGSGGSTKATASPSTGGGRSRGRSSGWCRRCGLPRPPRSRGNKSTWRPAARDRNRCSTPFRRSTSERRWAPGPRPIWHRWPTDGYLSGCTA